MSQYSPENRRKQIYHIIETIDTVRLCGLNKRQRFRKRGMRGGIKHKKIRKQNTTLNARTVNHDNLTKVDPVTYRHDKELKHNMAIFLVNIRSLRGKCLPLSTYIKDSDLDFGIITETWLTDSDTIWIDACDLNKDGYRISVVNRQQRRGGGIAFVHKELIPTKLIDSGGKSSFEFGLWKLNIKNTPMYIVGIYHPPPSGANRVNNRTFIEEFLDYLTEVLSKHKNVIVLGDFNMHINDVSDNDAQTFSDCLGATGLTQHVDFSTHEKGNRLDLVFTELQSIVNITSCKQGPFLSDHCIVLCETTIEKQTVQQIVDSISSLPNKTRIQILAPVVQRRKGEHKEIIESAKSAGFVRVRIDGKTTDLNDSISLDKNIWHDITGIFNLHC